MQSTLTDTLRKIDYPITILSNYPEQSSDEGKNKLLKLLEETSHQSSTSLNIDFQNKPTWDDEILEPVAEGSGLLVLNIQFKSNAWHFALAANYSPEEVSTLKRKKNSGAMLHARCHMMSDLTEAMPSHNPIHSFTSDTSKLSPDLHVLEEIAFLEKEHCLFSSDNIATYFFKGKEAPAILKLVGIGRAITFAAIGSGAGVEIDLSPEDQYYDHLVLWDKQEQTLVGAYRIGFTEEIMTKLGTNGLYLNHIFNFKNQYYEQLGNAIELSRSFILPSYQKNPYMLDALWKGLAQVAISRDCYTMYGSVTIAASFTPLSQAVLVDTLDRYHSEDLRLRSSISCSHPFIAKSKNHQLISNAWAHLGINKLNRVIEEIEQNQRSIPPLIRYYVSLGAKFLAFQVEESFNNAIYCLLKVDLKALPKRYQKRFLGQ